jgi:hypothetical protein
MHTSLVVAGILKAIHRAAVRFNAIEEFELTLHKYMSPEIASSDIPIK